MDREASFAACLLMAGQPDKLIMNGKMLTSTLQYMHDCHDWYMKNYPHVSGNGMNINDEANDWWKDYKIWLWENTRGNETSSTTAAR